ncbi:MAG: hypothetical protein ILP22_09800 [Oscillospiraceae bacterium]|nr:hypothetical protein [Oscillospiraceae bacterium]
MKKGKTLAFAAAVLTAFMPLSYSGITLTDIPSVCAEGSSAAVKLPEWVPTDFKSALEFRNRYGATHIEDELLCVVYLEGTDDERFSVSEGSMIDYGTYSKMEPGTVTTELYHHTFDSKRTEYPLRFEVVVYKGIKAGNFTVLFCDKEAVLTNCVQPVYEFTVTDKLDIEETDLHRWVPDCVTEYNDYKAHYGEVGLYEGKYLTFCMETSEGTPYSWTDFGHNTDGGILGNYGAFDCTPVTDIPPIDGGERNTINVYFPEVDGPATVSWKLEKTFGDEEIIKTLSADCVITDGGRTILTGDTVRIILTDRETGKLLDFPNEKEPIPVFPTIGYKTEDGSYVYADLALFVDSNPYFWNTTFKNADRFGVDLPQSQLPEGCYLTGNYREIKEYDNGAVDYIFKISRHPAGDVTGDGKTSILDVITLQNWLIDLEGTTLNNAGAADINGDGKINVLDLCCIKQILLNSNQSSDQKPADPTPDENTDHFNAEYIRTYINTSDTDITFPGHMIIKSQKEFEAFLNKYGSSGISDETKKLFADAKAKYTDEWFSDNSLFIALLEEGSGSIKHVVTNVTNDEVTIERWSPMVQTADMAWWCILVEGDKSLTFSENTKLVMKTVEGPMSDN